MRVLAVSLDLERVPMQITKTHLRAAAFVVGGAVVGAIATAATSAGSGEPKPFSGEPLGAALEMPATDVGATLPIDAAPHAHDIVRRAAFGSDSALDPRFLASPLSERFTQWSSGASNPGTRQAPHRDPLSEMIAAVFPSDESVRTVVLAPRVNPPPPPPDEEEETQEPCDDDPSCDDGEVVCPPPDEVCPPPGDTFEPPPNGVPEIDANLLGTGLLLLVGGALVLASRRTL